VAEAMRLSGAFDELLSTVTGYAALDQSSFQDDSLDWKTLL
jgi:hypothetical protein